METHYHQFQTQVSQDNILFCDETLDDISSVSLSYETSSIPNSDRQRRLTYPKNYVLGSPEIVMSYLHESVHQDPHLFHESKLNESSNFQEYSNLKSDSDYNNEREILKKTSKRPPDFPQSQRNLPIKRMKRLVTFAF